VLGALFVIAEAVGAFVSIPAQAALDAIFAFGALNLSIFGFRTRRTAGLVMTALFVDRLAVLTLPTTGVAPTTRMGFMACVTIAIVYIATWVLGVDISRGRDNEGFDLRKPLVSRSFTSAITVLSGFPLGWLAYEFTKPGALVIDKVHGVTWIPWLVALSAIILGALSEELLYRRLVAAMVQHTGQSQTPWISASIYGAVFFGSQNAGMIATAFVAGAFFAWSCERTGSIKPVATAHAIVGVLVFIVLPH
jgi:membrane protease YdiL (CAAX protease family)